VVEIAAKAKQTLPDCAGRVDSAVKLVLAGDVEVLPDGTARVASQANGATIYVVCNGTCECKDFPRAPSGWCKHKIAAGKQKRAQLDGASNGQAEAPDQPAPSAAADPVRASESVETPGLPESLKPYIVHLHGKPFVPYAGLLFLAHERGLVSLKAHFISVTPELALAEAEATFTDGKTYGECADSTPQNVGATVRAHFPRIALTRAKARVLRDALKIGIAVLEELDGEEWPTGYGYHPYPRFQRRNGMTIQKYGKHGCYWELYDDAGELVCICLYKKGAAEVQRRLQQLPAPPAPPTKTRHKPRTREQS
jgi:hypothetical protein